MSQTPFRTHEEATIESFRTDPAFAAEYLNAVLEDGEEAELLLALRRITEAFGGVSAVEEVEAELGKTDAWPMKEDDTESDPPEPKSKPTEE